MAETSQERLARWRSVGVVSQLSGNKTKELRDATDGHRIKVTKDEATKRGNLTTEHATKDERVDVMVRPDPIKYKIGRAE